MSVGWSYVKTLEARWHEKILPVNDLLLMFNLIESVNAHNPGMVDSVEQWLLGWWNDLMRLGDVTVFCLPGSIEVCTRNRSLASPSMLDAWFLYSDNYQVVVRSKKWGPLSYGIGQLDQEVMAFTIVRSIEPLPDGYSR